MRWAWALVAVALAGCPRRAPSAPPPPPKVVQLNATGELVDIEAALVPGYVVVIDFWATWCSACKPMEDALMAQIADEPRVLVRKVDIGDGDTPVADHYGVGVLPQLRVYDTHGELRFLLESEAALHTGERALELLRAADAGK